MIVSPGPGQRLATVQGDGLECAIAIRVVIVEPGLDQCEHRLCHGAGVLPDTFFDPASVGVAKVFRLVPQSIAAFDNVTAGIKPVISGYVAGILTIVI